MKTAERDGSARDLSVRARSLEVSPTVAMAQRAAALKASGAAVLDFSVGEPDQPTPKHISQAATAALEAGKTRYTSAAGLPELRAAVAARYGKDFKAVFAPEEVAITIGGKQALYLACQALLDRGDEVVIPSPYWPTFSEAVHLAGGRPILVRAQEKDGFKVTARMISKALGPRTKAVLINSPCNPTGAVVDPEDLLVIGDMAVRRKFTILYDDTYARLTFDGRDQSALGAVREAAGERLVVLGTASKSYCMTGWRIGWVLGPRALVDACAALVSHSTQCPATFAQVGAVEALTGPQKFVADLLAEYQRRRDFVHPALAAIPGVSCVPPAGGFYCFPNVGRHLSPRMPDTLALALRRRDPSRGAGRVSARPAIPGGRSHAHGRAQEGVRRAPAFWPGCAEPDGGRPRETALSALGSEGDADRLPAGPEGEGGPPLSLQAGVSWCIDLAAFDDWMRQEARRDEPYLGLTTLFYPMGRVERMEKDETLGPISSYSARFAREVGRSVRAVLGLEPDRE